MVSVAGEVDGGCAIRVEDTGIGIAAEDLPKVREPFAQVANTFSRDHEGTGLGLPLVEQIMKLHGGSLEIESELGKGTTVTVRFPPARVLALPAKQLSSRSRRSSKRRATRSGPALPSQVASTTA